MGAWRGPTNVSGLVSVGASGRSVHKDMARAVGSPMDLMVGGVMCVEVLTYSTASTGYVTF